MLIERKRVLFNHFILLYRFDVAQNLSKINAYYDRVENFFDDEKIRIENEFEENASKIKLLSLQDKQELIGNFGLELFSTQSDFPSLLRSSAIITIYNLIEQYLDETCHHLESIGISKIQLKDINGKGIERAKTYLTKVVGIEFKTFNNQWCFIKNLNLIRNHIVHNGSILPEDKSHKLSKFVESHHELSGKPGEELIVNKGFIHYSIDQLSTFFEELFFTIMEKYRLTNL